MVNDAKAQIIPRDRFWTALSHEEPDRVPLAFDGPACSIHQTAHQNLLHYLSFSTTKPDFPRFVHFLALSTLARETITP